MLITGAIVSRTTDVLKVEVPMDEGQPPMTYHITVGKELSYALAHDSVSGYIEDKRGQWVFATRPFIGIPLGSERADKAAILECFKVWDDTQGKAVVKIHAAKIGALYRQIKEKCVGTTINGEVITTVSEYLSAKAEQAWNSGVGIIAAGMAGMGLTAVDTKSLELLLKGWIRIHDKRLLLLLGLTNDQIRESYVYPGKLYTQICKNPFLVSVLTAQQAREIAEMINIPYDINQRRLGNFLRQLRAGTIGCDSTCMSMENYDATERELASILVDEEVVVIDNEHIYLKEVYNIETYLNDFIVDALNDEPRHPVTDLSLLSAPGKNGHCLDSEQQAAVEMAATNNISLIIGQAGTGKTTCVDTLIRIYKANNTKFLCLARTGQACNRIQQCSGVTAMTLDMYIAHPEEVQGTERFVIDESGMLDDYLIYSFLRTIPRGSAVTFIGDPGQLNPIGWGRFFEQMIASECVPIIRLQVIYRVKTADGTTDRIIENSKRIIFWKKNVQFDFVEGDNFSIKPGNISSFIKLFREYAANEVPITSFVVLCPFRRPLPGINHAAQIIFNRSKPCIVYNNKTHKWKYHKLYDYSSFDPKKDLIDPPTIYHIGDRVKMCKNNYKIKVFTGTEGIITEVDESTMTVDFGGPERTHVIPLAMGAYKARDDSMPDSGTKDSDDLVLSYAITVHQAQGSEWPHVIYYIPPDTRMSKHKYFCIDKLTYVAITRGTATVNVFSSYGHAEATILNSARPTTERLSDKLQAELPPIYHLEEDDGMEREFALRSAYSDKIFEKEYEGYNFYDDYDDYDDY